MSEPVRFVFAALSNALKRGMSGNADYFSFSWNIWIASLGLALPRLSFMS